MTTSAAPANAILLARIAELEAQLGNIPDPLQADELQQTLWLSGRYSCGRTASNRLKLTFTAQKGARNRDNARVYGAIREFVAYSDVAEHALSVLSSGNNLVDITAFESPWSNNSKRSDWVLTSITPRERLIQSAATEPPNEDPASSVETPGPSMARPSSSEIPSF